MVAQPLNLAIKTKDVNEEETPGGKKVNIEVGVLRLDLQLRNIIQFVW